MNLFQILILGAIQGAAELLPVSSSAHVIVAEKLMGLDPSRPDMTFFLVMLHTGTMFSVIVYFWNSWRESYFSSLERFGGVVKNVVLATIVTGLIGLGLQYIIEKVFLRGQPQAEVETLFAWLPLIGIALLAAGLLIIVSGLLERNHETARDVGTGDSLLVGAIQGLCLPFRGFSRSGATISAGLLLGLNKRRVEEFSFALAVVLTPVVVGREFLRLLKNVKASGQHLAYGEMLKPGLIGMVCSFVAGLLALWLLSRWLEGGKWQYFGYYCLAAAAVVLGLAYTGF